MSTRSALLYNTEDDDDYYFSSSIERPQYKSSKSRGAVASIRQKCTFRSRSSSYTSLKDEKMNSDDLITSSTAGLPLSENHSTFKKLVFLQSEKKDQKIALEASSPFDDNEEQEVESDESALFGRNRSIYSRRSSSPQSSWKSTLMRAVGGKKK